MPFVQPPVLRDRNPEQVELVEREPERADCALEERRKRDVEHVAAVLQQPPGRLGFFAAAFRQVDVGPPGESIFLVPRAFAVAEQNQFDHRASARIADRPANVAAAPSSSSIRSSWLYLQTRSVRLAEPVLICPAAVPTARSAIVESSVSPER